MLFLHYFFEEVNHNCDFIYVHGVLDNDNHKLIREMCAYPI